METEIFTLNTFRHFFRELRAALPPPTPDTDEAWAARDRAAIDAIIDLQPASLTEMINASMLITIRAAAMNCFGSSQFGQHPNPKIGASLARMTLSSMNHLSRQQSQRKREPGFDAAQHQEAVATIRRLLLQARHTEYTQPMRAPEPPPPPKQEPEPPPGPISDELIEAANEYCVQHPNRVAFLRRNRGMTNFAMFELDDKELIRAIVHGDTPQLRALDPRVYPPDDPRSRHSFLG